VITGCRIAQAAALRAVYVTPHHQYPTPVTLKAARRLSLLALARTARFAIVEDDYDHEFHYDGRPVLPLASSDHGGTVVYIGALSKILAGTAHRLRGGAPGRIQ
jgi:GntR family transcriptional regulator/MocR family aminotransferase